MISLFFSSLYSNFLRPVVIIVFIFFAINIGKMIITAFIDAPKKDRKRIIIVGIVFIIICILFSRCL